MRARIPASIPVTRKLGVPPHCPSCRCVIDWAPYSDRTFGYRQCSRCGESTERPGPAGWWWRAHRVTTGGSGKGRASESVCFACAAALIARTG
jgi:hypothetical protein